MRSPLRVSSLQHGRPCRWRHELPWRVLPPRLTGVARPFLAATRHTAPGDVSDGPLRQLRSPELHGVRRLGPVPRYADAA